MTFNNGAQLSLTRSQAESPPFRCRANLEQMRQSRPVYGTGLSHSLEKSPHIFKVLPLGSEAALRTRESWASRLRALMRSQVSSLSSEYGTYKTGKARFWPWLSNQLNSFICVSSIESGPPSCFRGRRKSDPLWCQHTRLKVSWDESTPTPRACSVLNNIAFRRSPYSFSR